MSSLTLPKKHIIGIEFFRLSNLHPLSAEDYFTCLNLIKPLFKNLDFQASTPGFYINRITNIDDDHGDSLRLTYYTIKPSKTLEVINLFVDNNRKIALFPSKNSKRPSTNTPFSEPDEKELRFRNFLNRNTQICLEVLENYGIHSFQELVVRYRYDLLPQRVPPELIFEPVFTKYSDYFKKLKDNSLDVQYWKDLVHLHAGNNFGLHFMVNMVAVPESAYHPWWIREDWILRKTKR